MFNLFYLFFDWHLKKKKLLKIPQIQSPSNRPFKSLYNLLAHKSNIEVKYKFLVWDRDDLKILLKEIPENATYYHYIIP